MYCENALVSTIHRHCAGIANAGASHSTQKRIKENEKKLSLRAVVFDYGMVLTGPPDAASRQALLDITGLPPARFDAIYWVDRHAYDEGKLTGLQFWQKFVGAAGLALSSETIAELNHWDGRMWTTQNPAMLDWQRAVRQRGLRTAILSNMGDNVLANMEREFDWFPQFDVLIWSFQHRMAKPEPAIYRLVLEKLDTQPAETLFLDDKPLNVDAARALGMQALVFSNIDKLRADLIAGGLDASLPLPE
jgi:putative hydrolase of the HAD superfamily